MEDRIIYLGNQVPCSIHALKGLINDESNKRLFLNVEKRNFECLNLLLWSKNELELLVKHPRFKGLIKNDDFKTHLDISLISNRVRLSSDGVGNLIELIRVTGAGNDNFKNLVKLHEGFYRTYSKFMSDIINFGQYNTSKIQNFFDEIPKSYKSFFDELYNCDKAKELLRKICLIFGGDDAFFKNKNSTMLLVSKVLAGVYWVDLNTIIKRLFPDRSNYRNVNKLQIEDLGQKTSKISFDSYEGEEISLFKNLNASGIFDPSYLARKSLYPLGELFTSDFFGNHDVVIYEDSREQTTLPGILKNTRIPLKRSFVDEYRGSNANSFINIAGVEFNHLKYIESSSFGIGPYLTYLFSSN